jgi:hypothetical protein
MNQAADLRELPHIRKIVVRNPQGFVIRDNNMKEST